MSVKEEAGARAVTDTTGAAPSMLSNAAKGSSDTGCCATLLLLAAGTLDWDPYPVSLAAYTLALLLPFLSPSVFGCGEGPVMAGFKISGERVGAKIARFTSEKPCAGLISTEDPNQSYKVQ